MASFPNKPPKCKREDCNRSACKNPAGGFFSHCGDTCRAPPCNNYSECKNTAEKKRSGPGFEKECYVCRHKKYTSCNHTGCGSNTTCVRSPSNGRGPFSYRGNPF